MVKRIALFLDGTWNTVTSNTNVWRLRSLCREGADQAVYYEQGLGTKYGEKARGGMLGYGLDQEVIDAYGWLVATYEPGDRIYLFGFSRGAYTARSLAGLISKCGLLEPGAPLGVGQLYERYRSKATKRTILDLRKEGAAPPGNTEERWMLTYCTAVPIRFIGVWDTVGSLGVPFGNIPVLSSANYTFLETDLRINQDFAYHAIALDEHREAFRPTLWTHSVHPGALGRDFAPRKLADVEQRWFPGAHANVGGGYDSDLLAQPSLKWIMDKAAGHGLTFRRELVVEDGLSAAPITDSYTPFLGGWYRRIPRNQPFQREVGAPPVPARGGALTATINETIDASVFARWRDDPAYRPAGLADWARRHGADPAAMEGTRRTDDLSAAPEPRTQPELPPNTAASGSAT